jgi:hypothetical protein
MSNAGNWLKFAERIIEPRIENYKKSRKIIEEHLDTEQCPPTLGQFSIQFKFLLTQLESIGIMLDIILCIVHRQPSTQKDLESLLSSTRAIIVYISEDRMRKNEEC